MLKSASLARGLESLDLPNSSFHHREHLQVTAYYLRLLGVPAAEEHLVEVLRRYATSLGHAEKFHDTLTRCWTRVVGSAVHERAATSFEEFLTHNPELLEKTLPLHYYSRDRLFSEAARRGWIEPDLVPLPYCPPHPGVKVWD